MALPGLRGLAPWAPFGGGQPSIRSRLVLLVLACVVPAAIMMAVLMAVQWRSAQEQLRSNLILTARALVDGVNTDLEGVQAGLKLLALSADMQPGDRAAFRAQATAARDALNLDNITLNDLQGQQLVNLRLPAGESLPQHTGAAQIAALARSEGPWLSDMYVGSVSGKRLVSVYQPVTRANQVVAVLSGTLDTSRLGSLFRHQPLPPTWISAVYDSSGTVVARTHEPERFVGQKARAETLRTIAIKSEGSFEGVTLKGTPVLNGYSRSPETGWTVIIGIPRQELEQELWERLLALAGATLLLLALSLALAFLIAQRISRSVQGLVSAATALGKRQPPQVGRLFFREAQEVGTAMAEASGLLTEAAHTIAASELRLRAILDTAQDAVIVTDAQGRVVFFNAQAVRMFRRDADEALGAPLRDFIAADCLGGTDGHPELRPRPDGTLIGRRHDGEPFTLEASVSSARAEGELLTTLILRDVTERIRAHEALVRSNLDLQQFAYVASHDLKNPLRTIGGFVDLLQRDYAGRLDERGAGFLTRIAKAVRTLETLTEDLLTYARLNSPRREPEPVNCARLLDEVVQLLSAQIAQAGARVEHHGLPFVEGDRTQLAQLFLNLVGNSIKYRSQEPPVVRVSATRVERAWLFEVADNGIGIAPEHRERVFEIFKRLHSAADYDGSGIGLSVCRKVVQNHGGSIWIEPAATRGCTVRFILPDRPQP
ncbi:MAG TPA: ATP-binding protein [Ramlibacter sp.]|nr:ATP-binding protein [Ramlibacter sp.]